MSVTIISKLCPQNHKCPAIKSCPVDALSQSGNAAPVVNEDTCIDCGECAKVCPMGALELPK